MIMECYSEQVISIFVDSELAAKDAQQLRDHLSTCHRCRQLLDALRAENRILCESLQELPDEVPSLAGVSRSRSSWTWGHLAIGGAVLALTSVVAFWIDALNIPETMQWLNPLSLSGQTNVIFNLSYYFSDGGTAMLSEYAAVIGKIILVLLLGGSAWLLGRRFRLRQPALRLLIVLLALSLPGLALERRHSEVVTVRSDETVEDTLLAVGNIVRVDGIINGDLLAFGGTVEVHGTVKGDLLSFAKRIVVSGTVEGNIFDLSNSLDLDGQLGHNLYGLMQSLRVNGRVGEGMLAGAGDVTLEGEVNRSVHVYAGTLDVSGRVGRELAMAGDHLTVTSTARIGGNLSAKVRDLSNVHIADGATITGTRDIQRRVRENRFTRPEFYFFQAVWLAAAMLVGWLGLILFPGFFQGSTHAVGAGWRSLGLGFAVLAGVPVAIILTAITLVGLPASLMLLMSYLVAIYLAQIWVGAFLGQILLKPTAVTKSDWLLGLLVGLLILTVVRFIPYLGGLVHFGVVCLGLGALAWQLYRVTRPAMTT